ncbi:AsmA-like C-terminal domain-containing protein [Sulfurimonas sp. C5]|uniref:YhdP family protein n=1 Tax=Sulfurimonas sp. C5 TaxID=3036947 RepID=UPI00245526B3|nr:AsmA-like C-terminal domain-containing protein [Sulfurimonas sp. C5]MDH4943945.1 AsmA-like C-terminal domain-containing protein [Sulfurimonas sp. C5]
MKDTIIINTISKIHSAIISFFSFIFLTLIFGFFILQNGLYLENFSIGNINIKKLYLKWDQKLDLYIDDLQIESDTKVENQTFAKKDINEYTKTFYSVRHLFNSIIIPHFQYHGFHGELYYNSDEKAQLSIDSNKLHLKTDIGFYKEFVDIHIKQFKSDNIVANGNIFIDIRTLENFSKLNFSVNNDANVTLYTAANTELTKYKVISHNNIQDIKSILRQIPFPEPVKYWVLDAIQVDNLELISLNGVLHFNDLQNGYKHLHILASANKLHYTYNPKLDAIRSDHTELEFKDGILFIRPKEALSYNFDLQNSWLKIDFTKPEELLTLFLQFSPILNDDMLHLLQAYKIKLPMKQNSGTVDTNLTLAVNLHTIGVDAKGTFFTQKGNFNYLGQDIDVKNLKLHLNNYDINVTNMFASYKNTIDANVDINYNAKEAKGDVKFKVTKCSLNNKLHLATKPLKAVYYIDKKQDILSIENSSWLYKDLQINLDKIDIPLDINTLVLDVPTTYFTLKNISDGFIAGKVNLKDLIANFDIDILNFKYYGIKSTRSNTQLKLNYKNNMFLLTADDDIYLDVVNSELKISNLVLKYQDNSIYLKKPMISFGKFTQAQVYAQYNIDTQQAHFSLENLLIKNPKNDKILYSNDKVSLNASIMDDQIQINSKELGATFNLDNTQWSLKLNDLKNLYKESDFLKKYHLTDGKVRIYKQLNDDTTKFKATLNYPYKLLYKDNKPVELYQISGKITKKQNLYIKVNDKINITVNGDIKINVHDNNISLPETLKWISTLDNNDSNESSANINISALNSAIYLGNDRYALADTLTVQYHHNILTAQLQHINGKAGFKLEHNNFHLYGEGFGDQFMGNLFIFSKFKSGTFDFNIEGTLDKYSGILLIEKSTLLDYVLLNNVLAFVNTVPSLITFSIPGYSQNGLYMNHAYVKFDYEKGIFNINEMYMDSKELKIAADGTADLKNDKIDLSLNLKTDIASDMSKIPVVGYILFDGKAISTSMKVTGKLSDPKIESAIAKEVIVAPINIIKRTLKLPFKIFE